MITVDTSALMAILLGEADGDACIAALEGEDEIVMSAGTLAEGLIVSNRRGVGEEFAELVEGLGIDVVDLTAPSARRAAEAYARWGKGIHPAALNFGDCFAYALASDCQCPLLFTGADFSATDVACVLPRKA